MFKYYWFILFISFLSFGQEQTINHYSFNELYDFNVSTVFDIAESEDHVMWFGTNEGLISFDGVNFKKYTHNKYAFSYTNIKFDLEGRVWCSNFGGQLFYLENDTLKLAVNWSSNSNFIDDYFINKLPIITVMSSATGEINQYSLTNKQLKKSLKRAKNVRLLSLFFKDTMQFAYYTQKTTKSLGQLQIFTPNSFPSEKKVTETYEVKIYSGKYSVFGNQKNLYLNTFSDSGQVYRLSKKKAELIIPSIDLSTYQFNAISYLKDKIWLLSKKGVSLFNPDGSTYLKNCISGISASCVFEDHEGNIWLGSLNKGLTIIPNLSFSSLHISEHTIHNSTHDKLGNIYIIDDEGQLIRSSPPYLSYKKLTNETLDPTPLYFDEDKQRLYLGAFTCYYSLKESRIIRSETDNINHSTRFKAAINISKDLYVTTHYIRSYLINNQNKTTLPINFGGIQDNTIRNFRGKYICATKNQSGLYIDYIDGLYYYDKVTPPKEILIDNMSVQTSALSLDFIDGETIWLATKSQQLFALKKGEVVQQIDLPVNAIKITTSKNYLILASQAGIYRYNRSSQNLELINETDGWNKGPTSSLFIWNDHCIVVGNHTIQKFPVNIETKNKVQPNIYIDGMQIGDSTLVVKPYRRINLPPGSNFISFNFRGLSVRSQKYFTYEYRLKESNKWVTTSFDNPTARFFNLESGEYTFEVRSCNESQVCSETKTIHFTIEKPFYQKWWFLVGIFLLIAILIFIILRERFKIIERQEKLKSEQQRLRKETYKSKIAAIRSQMNPHFIFNALNTIQEFILTNQQDIASEYLADFADLMRMYLNQSKQENILIQEEVETLEIYLRLENLRFNDELDYTIEVDPLITSEGSTIPVMLLQPYIENSIKHGLLHKKGSKQLSIRFTKEKNGIRCVITDNGIGRTASAKINAAKSISHQSFATGANESRIDLINQQKGSKITVRIIDLFEDNQATGTRVELFIEQ